MEKKLLIGEVPLEDLLERLTFTEEEMSRAVLEQAKLFMEASRYRIAKMKVYQQAKRHLHDVEANASLTLRAKYAGTGDKLTEKNLEALLRQQKEVQEAGVALDKAERLEEYAKLLLEAYRQRKDVLKILAQFAYVEDSLRLGFGGMKKMRDTQQKLNRFQDKDEED